MKLPLLSTNRLPSVPAGLSWHEGGSGPVLLLINGWTASGVVWPERLITEFERRFRVIRIDNRGSGWSRAAPTPFTIEDLADDARAVLRKLGIPQATVLGFSMGGMIAQSLAARYPEVVERLVLVATSPPAPAHLPADDETTWLMFRRRGQGQSLQDYLIELWSAASGAHLGIEGPVFVPELVRQLLVRPTPRDGALAQARAAATWHGPKQLSHITAPTTVVHGVQDVLRPVGNAMRLARLIPDAEYVELPGVGHLVPYEAPEVLERLLLGVRAGARTS